MFSARGPLAPAGAFRVAAATAVPLPVIAKAVEKGVDLGVEFGPEKYFVCWWDKVELEAFARAFAPLARER